MFIMFANLHITAVLQGADNTHTGVFTSWLLLLH